MYELEGCYLTLWEKCGRKVSEKNTPNREVEPNKEVNEVWITPTGEELIFIFHLILN